jgi:hypothetical protein
MNLITGWPRMMSPEMAEEYVGGPTIFKDLTKKRIKPRVQRKGLTRYDRYMLDAALDVWKGLDE